MTKPSQGGFPSLGNAISVLWSTLITEEPTTMSCRFMPQFASKVWGTSQGAVSLPHAVPPFPWWDPHYQPWEYNWKSEHIKSLEKNLAWVTYNAVSFNHMSGKPGINGSRISFHSFLAKLAQVQKKDLVMLGSHPCSAVRHGKAQSSNLLPEIRYKCVWGFLLLKE